MINISIGEGKNIRHLGLLRPNGDSLTRVKVNLRVQNVLIRNTGPKKILVEASPQLGWAVFGVFWGFFDHHKILKPNATIYRAL